MSLRDALPGSDASSRTRLAALVLAVVITVALAATAAVYVLDSEDDGPVNAAVNTTVDDRNRTVTFTVEEIGDAESFVLRGEGIDGSEVLLGALGESGDSMTLDADETLADDGEVNVVATDGGTETAVSSVEWNWSDDTDDDTDATVNAAVSTIVVADDGTLTITVNDMGDADSLVLRGDGVDGDEVALDLEDTGDTTTVSVGDELSTDPGAVSIVAIAGDAEDTILTIGDDSSGDGGQINAAVTTDVDDDARELTFTVDEIGDVDRFRLRGEGVDEDLELDLEATGDDTTVGLDHEQIAERGSAFVVGSDGEGEVAIASVDWDWSGDDVTDTPVNGTVTPDVDDDARAVTLTVADMGTADAFVLRGYSVEGTEIELDLENTGDTTTVSADDGLDPERGVANIVAVDGQRENTVGQFEWDWTTDDGSPTESQ